MELMNVKLIFATAYVLIISYAIVSDYFRTIIPNLCSILLILLFVLFSIFFLTIEQFAWHLVAGATVFLLTIGFYAFGWFGGGDVKILTAVMLWAGPTNAMSLGLWMALIGCIMALSLMGLRSLLKYFPDMFSGSAFLRRPVGWVEEGAFPYGLAIGVAALFTGPSIFFQ